MKFSKVIQSYSLEKLMIIKELMSDTLNSNYEKDGEEIKEKASARLIDICEEILIRRDKIIDNYE